MRSGVFALLISIIVSGLSCYGQLLPGHAYKSVGQYHWLLNHATITDPELAVRIEENARIWESYEEVDSNLVVPYSPDYMYVGRHGDTYSVYFDKVYRRDADDKIEPIGFTRLGGYLVVFDKSLSDYIRLDSKSFSEFVCVVNPENTPWIAGHSENYLFRRRTELSSEIRSDRNSMNTRPVFALPDTVDIYDVWNLKPVRFRSEFAQQVFENFMTSPVYRVGKRFFDPDDHGYISRCGKGTDYQILVYPYRTLCYEEINPVGYVELNGHIMLFDESVKDDLVIAEGEDYVLKTYTDKSLSDFSFFDLLFLYPDEFFPSKWGVIESGLGAGSHYFNWPPLGLHTKNKF